MFLSFFSHNFELYLLLWALELVLHPLLGHVSSYLSQDEICPLDTVILPAWTPYFPFCFPMLLFVIVHHKLFSNYLVGWSLV